jgi:hypothetical protein
MFEGAGVAARARRGTVAEAQEAAAVYHEHLEPSFQQREAGHVSDLSPDECSYLYEKTVEKWTFWIRPHRRLRAAPSRRCSWTRWPEKRRAEGHASKHCSCRTRSIRSSRVAAAMLPPNPA